MNETERLLAIEEARRQTEKDLTARQAPSRPSADAGVIDRLHWIFERLWRALDPLAHLIVRLVAWVVPPLLGLAARFVRWFAFETDADGVTTIAPVKAVRNAIKLGILFVCLPLIFGALYYYGTWRTYSDIYVPNAGVFLNQTFVHPNGAGQVIAPRDEIFTVLGKQVEEDGSIVPIRFDIDSNFYFWFYHDANRPDLAAAKLDSQSPYGLKCSFEATGIYTRLPRYIRIWAVKWLDTRAEIVNVVRCDELKELPEAFEHR